MVYHGPSKGCQPCRLRKIRCDRTRPHCHTCIKRGVACPGPRVGNGETEFHAEIFPIGQPVPPKVPKQTTVRIGRDQSPTVNSGLISQIDTSTKTSQRDYERADQGIFRGNHRAGVVCYCDDCSRDYPGSSSGDDWTPETSLIPRTPPGGQYGNVHIGVCKAEPALVSLLDWWRRTALYDLSPMTPQARPDLGKKAWALSLISLHDECLGYAFLAVASCYFAKVSSSYDMNLFHLKARVRAVSSARKQLQAFGLVERMISNLSIILASELVAEDFNACKKHAKFLASILQPRSGPPPPASESTRHSFLHMDIERATALGTQCFLDLSTWKYEKAALDAWSRGILADTAWQPPTQPDLDGAALADPILWALITQIRYYDDLLRHPSTATTISRATAFQLSTAIDILAGKVLNYFTTQVSRLADITAQGNMTSLRYLATAQQAAAALAALYHLRLRTRQEYAGPTYDAAEPLMIERFCAQAPRIHRRLQRLMRVSEDAFTALSTSSTITSTPTLATAPSQFPPQQEATRTAAARVPPAMRLRLWILHVGAIMEATADFGRYNTPPPVYCREALARVLRDAGLSDREDVVGEIFGGFLSLRRREAGGNGGDGGGGMGMGVDGRGEGEGCGLGKVVADLIALPRDVYGPRWMSPVLRTWGLTNWDGEMG